MFEELIGNAEVKETLEKTYKTNNILHAYLFVGQVGIGKKLFAIEFAKMILFTEEEISFNLFNHPDFSIIDTEENTIKIEQIRDMQKNIYEKPIKSEKKVYIINDSEKLTKEAANCILKILEEPPGYVVIILITSNEKAILNTIRSRCNRIMFNKIDDISLEKYLKEELKYTNITKNMLKAANGSISKSIQLIKDIDLYKKTEEVFLSIGDGVSTSQKNKLDFLEESEFVYNEKDNIYNLLEYLNVIFLEILKQNVNDIRYIECIQIVESAKRSLDLSANFNMTIDNLLFSIWEVVNKERT